MYLELQEAIPRSKRYEQSILFVHGGWHGAWCWQNFLPFFAKQGFRSYAVSLRGHGKSDRPGGTKIDDYLEDLITTVGRIGHPIILIGHSMGALLIQKYAALGHECKALILLTPVHPHKSERLKSTFILQYPLSAMRLVNGKALKVYSSNKKVKNILFSPNTDLNIIKMCIENLVEEEASLMKEVSECSIDVSAINVPVMIIGAKLDKMINTWTIKSNAKLFNTEAEFISAGHNIMLDTNWDKTAKLINNWLRNVL